MKQNGTSLIGQDLLNKLAQFEPSVSARRVGLVRSISDGVAKVHGLPNVAYLEIVSFASGAAGVVVNLEEDSVGIIVLGDFLTIKEGDEVRGTGDLLSIPVGESYLGRVINPLGEVIDGKSILHLKTRYPMEKIAASVVHRQPVNTPLPDRDKSYRCHDSHRARTTGAYHWRQKYWKNGNCRRYNYQSKRERRYLHICRYWPKNFSCRTSNLRY